ncbi:tryptophan synthase subunit alpha [Verticiella sediminum]|uniref:Tryptophan synthase alpha chain n=1 Tax=Verticiella sediminum TaxID=1247510 RepID=A0A556ATQ2_9BURK|nr:tryptophan synthase subunit alpha [Verticiella sediminum]TSH95765.1 tryptophan synthase subunit alpha [Verticiella sediminum]
MTTVKSSPRLSAAFAARQGGTALIPYLMAGDPAPAVTVAAMHALVAAGADVIELGVPFSDPMADGPVIQAAAERALANGVSLRDVLGMVREFRAQDADTPIVLMGYANPIERMGAAAFVDAAAQAGVDGVLTVDYPPEEVDEFSRLLGGRQIDPIFLLAPTSSDARIATVAEVARGYVYYVSLKGVTGAGHLDTADVARNVARIRRSVTLPVGVGFGIRDAASASAVAEVADAVVIGSKLVDTIAQAVQGVDAAAQPEAAARAAGQWLATIRSALDARQGKAA